ncbi:MAG TPA: hypothetical protein PLV92_20910, partial [Pirellulaceae bacterium]|nr:hypothetical protein [Pirellulaceae bacterium]
MILLSAFLLFQVQPVISKAILPWFGGSPAVWTTCMLFFQVLLLGGYAYAHWLTSRPAAFQQAVIHVVVLGLAILLLPIVPGESWKPTGSEHPTTRILLLLGVCVGLPYFALSSTGPLVQAWFSKVCPERSPYWLYALSNVGSLGALLSYPFVFEPMMSTRAQGLSWSAGFAVFAIACGGLAMTAWRGGIEQRELSVGKVRPDGASDGANATDLPPVADRLSWLGLPALASVFLLAVTNHLCQDVAVVPFMWVAPLSLYLLSFIFVFAGSRWYSRTWHGLAAAAALAGVACLQLEFEITQFITNRGWVPTLEVWEQRAYGWMDALHVRWVMVSINLDGLSLHSLNECIVVHASTYLAALFFVCMVCHGEMVRRRPASKWLTSFYMMTSAGGALGGIIVALICPAVFKTYLELNWAMTASYALLLFTLGTQLANRWKKSTTRRTKAVAVAASLVMSLVVACAGFIVGAQVESFDTDDLATARSFYGVLHVEEANQQSDVWRGRELMNGRILH